MTRALLVGALLAASCGGNAEGINPAHPSSDAAPDGPVSVPVPDAAVRDVAVGMIDGGAQPDSGGGSPDSGGGSPDSGGTSTTDAGDGNIISGGPCSSGAAGQTAFRIRFTNASGTAQVVYEAFGLPDHSNEHAGAYGYQIGFTPPFVDPFLGAGGLGLDDSDFVDLEMSTGGLATIRSATLAIYGRSYAVSTDGSFNWQTFDGTGATDVDFVSNVPPYRWYRANVLGELGAGEAHVLIRIKAGPSSDSLVVNRIELCVDAI
jgi:hypothetical protein